MFLRVTEWKYAGNGKVSVSWEDDHTQDYTHAELNVLGDVEYLKKLNKTPLANPNNSPRGERMAGMVGGLLEAQKWKPLPEPVEEDIGTDDDGDDDGYHSEVAVEDFML